VDTTTAAHDCITGVLELLELLEQVQQPAGAHRERILTELIALAETGEAVGSAPDTDPVIGADALEVAAAARTAAEALAGVPREQSLLAA
jgi:hypothetical protein